MVFFLLCAFSSCLLLVIGGLPGSSVGQQMLAIQISMLLGAVALAVLFSRRLGRLFSVPAIFLLAILLRLMLVSAEPLLEDDHFRYLWDGYQTLTHGDPYRHAPAEFFGDASLSSEWQVVLTGINNPDLKTVYGPVQQYLFALAYIISPASMFGLKILLVAVDLCVLVSLWKLAVSNDGLLAYAIHPLLLQEAIASAHPDAIVGGLVLVTLVFWQRRRVVACGLLLGIAVATKVSALLLVPLLLYRNHSAGSFNLYYQWRWSLVLLLTTFLMLVALYLPLVGIGRSELESLWVFGSEWRFNPIGFRVVQALLPDQYARITCGLLLILFCLLLLLRGYRSRGGLSDPSAALLLMIALLLLSPVVNPWYWLWLLPLAVYCRRDAVVLCMAFAPVSYWNGTVLRGLGWSESRFGLAAFEVPWMLSLLQLLVLLGLIWREWRRQCLSTGRQLS